MDACAAVDIGRILAGEERDGALRPRRARPCRRRRSRRARRRSAPGRARGRRRAARRARSTTFLSTIALRTIAPSPTSTPSMSTEPSTFAPESDVHLGREHRPRARAARDDDARADHRVDRHARVAGILEHELRRRQPVGLREDRPVVVVEVEDRVGRDQVHVRLVVGVERPDVAPVAALALRDARDVGVREVEDLRLRRARRASG